MMKIVVLTCALSALVAAKNIRTPVLDEHWELWKRSFGKNFSHVEEDMRRVIWERNLRFVERHNLEYEAGLHTYTLGMNEFAHLTSEEFVSFYNGFRQRDVAGYQSCNTTFLSPSNIGDLPATVDWRKQGFVTPVKNQGQCGSCWAFSTTGSLEGQHFKKTGKLVSLSEQNLVDCSSPYGNQGCQGGLMDQAFAYIKNNSGIDTEQCYPYVGMNKKCKYQTSCVGATVAGCTDIPPGDEAALKTAAATVGPISVAIDASHQSFQLYSHGVYDPIMCSSTYLDHGVLVVGYGRDIFKDFWLVKNSWGDSWGMDGYIEMVRNKKNKCGIATSASYPLV